MEPDQIRRQIRKQLHAARCADNDQSPERLRKDAAYLNAELKRLGVYFYAARWGDRYLGA